MLELKGKYNTAKIFTDNAEASALTQIEHLLNQEFITGSKVRIMPDVHSGMGCTIGMTMTITDKVVPNLVGVDIGCGMETVLLHSKHKHVELAQLDKAIHKLIPSGFSVRSTPHGFCEQIDLSELRCINHMDMRRAALSIGTLGGGNHFIELDKDDDGQLYLIVHSGSRNLGKQACDYYQNLAADSLGRKKGDDRVLAYLTGNNLDDYLHDMAIIQRYAYLNRKAIIRELEKHMKFKIADRFTTVHNYIDLDNMILRKGAISAQKGERILIPLNMRDGCLICVGKGNADWNYSAPHGAGRIMSRKQAKESVTMSQFEKSMTGIYSSCVNKNTIDESPFTYKSADEIMANIADTAEIVKVIKPLYNFKASGE